MRHGARRGLRLQSLRPEELYAEAKELRAPIELVRWVAEQGKLPVVTFTAGGIRLKSGQELPADIIVTATGLNLQLFGGIALTVDGEPVDLSQKVAFKGMMLSDVPNFAFIVGYTNSSWTLKVGLLCEHFCRMLAHMDQHGYAVVRPRLPSPDMPTRPLLDFGAGYVQRALSQLPRQGTSGPWVMAMDPNHDAQVLRHGPVADPCLVFDTASRPRHPVAAPKQVAVSA